MDPISYLDSPDVTQARNTANQTQQAYSNAQAEGMTLPQRLTEALNKKFSTNNPMVQQREGQLNNYLNVLDTSQSSVLPENNNGTIFSPIQQANLINSRRNAAFTPLTTTNYLLGLEQGGIGDVVDSVGRAYGADVQRMQGQAEAARNNYLDVYGLAKDKAAYAAQALADAESKRRWEAEFKKPSGSGGGLGGLDLLKELKNLGILNGETTGDEPFKPTEPRPTTLTTPGKISLGGQWVATNNGWVPFQLEGASYPSNTNIYKGMPGLSF